MSESNWYIYYSGRSSFKNYTNDLIRKFNPSIPKEIIMGSEDTNNVHGYFMDTNTCKLIEVNGSVSINDLLDPNSDEYRMEWKQFINGFYGGLKLQVKEPSKESDIHKPSRYLASDGSEVKDLIAKATKELNGELAFYTGCMIKYACRWNKAGGKKDLAKIVEYARILINLIIKDPSILTWSHEQDSKLENDVIDACYPWVNDFVHNKNLKYNQCRLATTILRESASWWVRGNSYDGFCCTQKLIDIVINGNDLIKTL